MTARLIPLRLGAWGPICQCWPVATVLTILQVKLSFSTHLTPGMPSGVLEGMRSMVEDKAWTTTLPAVFG